MTPACSKSETVIALVRIDSRIIRKMLAWKDILAATVHTAL